MTTSTESPVARLTEFADKAKSGNADAMFVIFSYISYASVAAAVWHFCSDQEFTFIVTLAGLTQAVAFYLLLHKMRSTKSSSGISSKTLQMYVLATVLRLSSTLTHNGYLPTDRSGDWVYQATDIASLLLLFQLLFFLHKRYKESYQAELDTFPIGKVVPACVLLGVGLHGSLNRSPVFDITWTIGLWCDAFAMLPQLWMLVAKGGKVEALRANFVALMFLSRAMMWMFWYTGYPELAPKDSPGAFNRVGTMIMAAQSMQLLLSADFMYHYFKWQSSWFCGSKAQKPQAFELVLPDMSEV